MKETSYILFVRAVIVSIITISLLSCTVTTVSGHIQAQTQPFDSKYRLGSELQHVQKEGISNVLVFSWNPSPGSGVPPGNNNKTAQYWYDQGLAMGLSAGPYGIEDSAQSAVCPSSIFQGGITNSTNLTLCDAMVKGYEDGFAHTCSQRFGDTCPPERRMFNAYHFVVTECISDATDTFMRGYYRAHVDFFNGQPYNETAWAPPLGQNFHFDWQTGMKYTNDNNTRTDFIQGYQLEWKDARRGVFQVDC